MFLGLDSSTQSLTAVLIDSASGEISSQLSVNFGADLPHYQSPSGFLPGETGGQVHANPLMWLEALDLLFSRLASATDLSKVKLIAGSGQQHGSVYLDSTFNSRLAALDSALGLAPQIAPALTRATSPIWMDTSTGAECAEITAAMGGPDEVCRRSGSIAIERFTGPQIRRFYKIGSRSLRADQPHPSGEFVHRLGDRREIRSYGFRRCRRHESSQPVQARLGHGPAGRDSAQSRGQTASSCSGDRCSRIDRPYFTRKYGLPATCRIALFTGDNPASLVGMGATTPGNVVISLGTSDTFFAAMPGPKTDPNGYGHVFGNPAGGFMSLICFRNGSLAREALRDSLSLDWSAFDREALASTASAAGAI